MPRPVVPHRSPAETLSALRMRDAVVMAVLEQVGRPYRFAGRVPGGFDCSGLVDYVFSEQGVGMPRTAAKQARVGRWVPLDETRLGDLVFFGQGAGAVTHVGLVVSAPGEPLEMVHAATSRGVVRTRVDRSEYWLARLLFARSVID